MISEINGTVSEINEDSFVLLNNGIGFLIYSPGTVIARLPGIDNEIKIYTHFKVTEDSMTLYGFLDKRTRELFLMLLSVNGVGPKAALSILSTFSEEDLRFKIISQDSKEISKAPGIGKKTAERIILDLHDKIKANEYVDDILSGDEALQDEDTSSIKNDAIQALIALGYSRSDSYKAVSNIKNKDLSTVEDILKEALKELAFL